MKSIGVRILSAVFALGAIASASPSQEVDKIIVNVPYDFVVEGTTLPAGTYKVRRISDNDTVQLAITSFENHTGVLVISSEVSAATKVKPAARFEQIGDQHVLTSIATAQHVFTIPVSAKLAPLVASNKKAGPAASSASGSN